MKPVQKVKKRYYNRCSCSEQDVHLLENLAYAEPAIRLSVTIDC